MEVLDEFTCRLADYADVFREHPVSSKETIQRLLGCERIRGHGNFERLSRCIQHRILPLMKRLKSIGSHKTLKDSRASWERWGLFATELLAKFDALLHSGGVHNLDAEILILLDETEILSEQLERMLETRMPCEKAGLPTSLRLVAAPKLTSTIALDASESLENFCSTEYSAALIKRLRKYEDVLNTNTGLHWFSLVSLLDIANRKGRTNLGKLIENDVMPLMQKLDTLPFREPLEMARSYWTIWGLEVETAAWSDPLMDSRSRETSSHPPIRGLSSASSDHINCELDRLESITVAFIACLKQFVPGMCHWELAALAHDCRHRILLSKFPVSHQGKRPSDEGTILSVLIMARFLGMDMDIGGIETVIYHKILPVMRCLRDHRDLDTRIWAEHVWRGWIRSLLDVMDRARSECSVKNPQGAMDSKSAFLAGTKAFGHIIEEIWESENSVEEWKRDIDLSGRTPTNLPHEKLFTYDAVEQ